VLRDLIVTGKLAPINRFADRSKAGIRSQPALDFPPV
jgi:hypothetical protein